MLVDVQSHLNAWWAPGLAVLAGLLSFASPCVLPLVPGYLAFVVGQPPASSDPGARDTAGRWRSLWPVLSFVAGFTVVFTVVFGFTASALRGWILSDAGQRVAGAFVLAFGVFMLLYAARTGKAWLYTERRPFLGRLAGVRPGPAWAFPLGMAFAAGWTPCIGPVLGGIATLALTQGTTARAILLLFAYSMGLGIPFVLIGLGLDRTMGAMRFFSRNYRWFAGVSGVLMIAIGVLLVSGLWVRVLAPLLHLINGYSPPI
jgi:cytochrome c-type biogenesis protein